MTNNELLARIEELEDENRRLRRAFVNATRNLGELAARIGTCLYELSKRVEALETTQNEEKHD